MKILLVNDDGIRSLRLSIAQRHLEKFGEVWVVAPSEEQSAKSMAITLGEFKFKRQRERVYTVEGTPADCVTFGLFGLKLNPDFVVSGVNYGYNVGADIMYSGTVGAALHACYHGYPSIAFSGYPNGNKHIEEQLTEMINYVLDRNLLSEDYVINVNFPNDKVDYKGRRFSKVTNFKVDIEGTIEDDTFKYNQKRPDYLAERYDDTDLGRVHRGFITMTRLTLDKERVQSKWKLS